MSIFPSSQNRKKRHHLLMCTLITVMFILSQATFQASAEETVTRTKIITVLYTEYEWWMTRWSDNQTVCEIFIDHEGKPSNLEIFYQCGSALYEEWLESEPCSSSTQSDAHTCPGYYLFLADSAPRAKGVIINLPSPEVTIDIIHCPSQDDSQTCSEIPHLLIQAEEPLPNEHIIQVQGHLNDIPFVCLGSTCEVPLRPTPEEGVPLSFWADSSFGDSSVHYHGRVRLLEGGGDESSEGGVLAETADQQGYQVSLISDQYENESFLACSNAWHAFPPLGAPPEWLSNPSDPKELATDEPLTYLAGKLIAYGLADASTCPDGGLLSNGYASPCGLSEARSVVTDWQNNYDPYIIQAAQKVGIPSELLKRVFIQESQLWPENMEGDFREFGLGHLTEWGADTTLLWNNNFYAEFCPFVLSEQTCQLGYGNLGEEEKDQLRGALLTEASVESQALTKDFNFGETYESIVLFAESILGQCKQTKQIIYNYTEKQPSEVCSYEDLWRFTLVNYHAGSECLGAAIEQIVAEDKPLTWYFVSTALNVDCPNAVEYISTITSVKLDLRIK